MPVDLPPPNNKPGYSAAASWNLLLERSMNWLALIIGIGLCLWVINLGLTQPG